MKSVGKTARHWFGLGVGMLALWEVSAAAATMFTDDFESGALDPDRWYAANSAEGRVAVAPAPDGKGHAVHLTTPAGNCEVSMTGRVSDEPFTLRFRFVQPAAENRGYAGVVRFSAVRHYWWIEWMPPCMNLWTTWHGKWAARWTTNKLACDKPYTVLVHNERNAVRLEVRTSDGATVAHSSRVPHDDGPSGHIAFGAHSGKGLRGVWFDDVRLTAERQRRPAALTAAYKRRAPPGPRVRNGQLGIVVSSDKGALLAFTKNGGDLFDTGVAAVVVRDFSAGVFPPETDLAASTVEAVDKGAISAEFATRAMPEMHGRSLWTLEKNALRWDVEITADFATPHEIAVECRVPVPVWADGFFYPSRGAPFTRRTVRSAFQYRDPSSGVVLPMVSWFSREKKVGLTVFADPALPIPALRFEIAPGGSVPSLYVSFNNQRLHRRHPVRVRLYLAPHGGDWRPGLGWVVRHFPEFFTPRKKVPEGHMVIAGKLAAGRVRELRKMGFAWQEMHLIHSPFYGVYIGDGNTPEEIASARRYIERIHGEGFHYFFYWSFNETRPDFAKRFPDSIFRDRAGNPTNLGWHLFTWMVPFPDTSWHDHVLDQLHRVVHALPELDGVFCDNAVHHGFSFGQDDECSMAQGKPCCQFAFAQHAMFRSARSELDRRGMALWTNGACDLSSARNIDGILVEADRTFLESQQYLGLLKPMVFITYYKADDPLRAEHLERNLQTALRCGSLLGFNEWELKPGKIDLRLLKRYLPMFERLRQREWVFDPGPLEIPNTLVGNIFRTPQGYTIPLISRRAQTKSRGPTEVTIRIPDSERIGQAHWYRVAEAAAGWRPVQIGRDVTGALRFSLPEIDGAAMLVLERR